MDPGQDTLVNRCLLRGLAQGQVGRSDLGQAMGLSPLLGQGNPSCEGWHRNRTQQARSYFSPSSPKPSKPPPSNETDLSSVGRTPYHSRVSNPISPFKANTELTNHSRNMACLAPHAADIEQKVDPNPEWIDEDHGTSMPDPHLLYADATDEDAQDNIEEEEDDLEEDENDDSTEEDDSPNGRDKEEEDAEIRKRSIEVVKNGDRWLKTTNRSDPRRIRIC